MGKHSEHSRRRRGTGGLACVVALAAWASASPGTAWADTVYRCESATGARAYSSEPLPGQSCRAMVLDVPAPASGSSRPVASAPAAGGGDGVSFRTAAGSAAPAAPARSGGRVTRGSVYRYERDGVTHYTNVRPGGSTGAQVLFSYVEACYACVARPGVDFSRVGLNLNAFAEEVRAAALQHGVDEALVRAVIHAESAFNPNALSHKGAQGLMQLIPATADRFGVTDAFEPTQNISGGVRYLAWLLNRFNGNVTLASAAYNAGEGAVDRFNGIPPYAETQMYVERVSVLADRYRAELALN